MKQLTSVALAQEIKENPYAGFMTATLAERCQQIQEQTATSEWLSLRHELTLAKTTLCDHVQLYSAMHLLPADHAGKLELVIHAGSALRAAIAEIASLVRVAAQIESEAREKHDPTITLQFLQQTVRVVDKTLREAEETGELKDAERLIEAITRGVDEGVRLPLGSPLTLGGSEKAVGISPSSTHQVVETMINPVPAA